MQTHVSLGVLAVGLLLLATAVPGRADVTVEPGDCASGGQRDPDQTPNVAFPDAGAHYWATQVVITPASHLLIEGLFPRARYMSFHVYGSPGTLADAIADVDIQAMSGVNPFIEGADRGASGAYEVFIRPGPRPAVAEPNTLYAVGSNGEPLAHATLMYRIYLSEADGYGGVPLPRITHDVQAPVGLAVEPFHSCSGMDLSAGGSFDAFMAGSSLPADSPQVGAPAGWTVHRSQPQPNDVGPATVNSGLPFYPNLHNAYMSLRTPRTLADLVVVRMKAPTFPDTRGSDVMGAGQLRYWSMCANEAATTRVTACISDERALLDDSGYVTFVAADADHRPASLRATDNWIAAGAYPDTFLIYRNMLPDAAFSHAIQDVPAGADPAATLGEYHPAPTRCSRAQFEIDRCGVL